MREIIGTLRVSGWQTRKAGDTRQIRVSWKVCNKPYIISNSAEDKVV